MAAADDTPDARSASETKRALRARTRASRAAVDPDLRARMGVAWARGVLQLADERDATTVAVYLSYGTEPPTADLVRTLAHTGRRVLVPVLLDDRDLDWAVLPAGDPGAEPPTAGLGRELIAEADLVVVPALLAGRDGARLGQGGGSYDRALGRLRAGTPVVALTHDDEVAEPGEIPRESHDHPVTHVVTPARTVVIDTDAALPIDPDAGPADGSQAYGADVALAVAAGGAIGAAARWSLSQAWTHDFGSMPWATLTENVVGAFLLAVLMVFAVDVWPRQRYLRPFLGVGVLGGFTTFSTFAAEIRALTDAQHGLVAMTYLVVTLAAGLLAAVAGLLLARSVVHGRVRARAGEPGALP